MIDPAAAAAIRDAFSGTERVTVMTGAGISAESGIPTFRGPEGYWTVGSKVYHPQEMATQAMFRRRPLEVWRWYCYRRSVCRNAEPNPGHLALVAMEQHLGDRFMLITQNVDGLHLRAGSSPEHTYQIHGNIDYMRCADGCSADLWPVPDRIPSRPVTKEFTNSVLEKLRCPVCGGRARPHVLWFDEYYDEAYYRFESALAVASQTSLLLVVGTSGATNLPNQVAHRVLTRGGRVVDINTEANVFSELARHSNGFCLTGASGQILPRLIALLG
jgi:NAD-dependent deacetylase